jgi:hypothetical protein
MTAAFSTYAIALVAAWTSGISLYLTIFILGVLGNGIIDLPGELEIFSNPFLIAFAFFLYLVEFFADKIPFVDSLWDGAHTLIRPVGGLIVGYFAGTELGPVAQAAMALFSGAVALDTHAVKATARAAINTSPEPFSNIAASLSEDAAVLLLFWLVIRHPFIAAFCVIVFLVGSFFFLGMMWRLVKKLFGWGRKKEA